MIFSRFFFSFSFFFAFSDALSLRTYSIVSKQFVVHCSDVDDRPAGVDLCARSQSVASQVHRESQRHYAHGANAVQMESAQFGALLSVDLYAGFDMYDVFSAFDDYGFFSGCRLKETMRDISPRNEKEVDPSGMSTYHEYLAELLFVCLCVGMD